MASRHNININDILITDEWAFLLDYFSENEITSPCIERKDRIQKELLRSYSILSWCKKSEVKKIINLLYSYKPEIGLTRKRLKAFTFLD